MPNRN